MLVLRPKTSSITVSPTMARAPIPSYSPKPAVLLSSHPKEIVLLHFCCPTISPETNSIYVLLPGPSSIAVSPHEPRSIRTVLTPEISSITSFPPDFCSITLRNKQYYRIYHRSFAVFPSYDTARNKQYHSIYNPKQPVLSSHRSEQAAPLSPDPRKGVFLSYIPP